MTHPCFFPPRLTAFLLESLRDQVSKVSLKEGEGGTLALPRYIIEADGAGRLNF